MTLTIGVQKDRGRRVPRARLACARGSRAGRRDERRVPADGQLDGAAQVSGPLQDRASVFEAGSDLQHRYGVYGIRVLSDALTRLAGVPRRPSWVCRVCDGSSAVLCRRLEGATFRSRPGSWYRYAFLQDGSSYVRLGQCRRVSGGGRRPADHMPARRKSFVRVVSDVSAWTGVVIRSGQTASRAAACDDGDRGWEGGGFSGKQCVRQVEPGRVVPGRRLPAADRRSADSSRDSPRGVLAYPGPPRIKLFSKVAGHVLGRAADGPAMNNDTDKRILRLGDHQSCRDPVALRSHLRCWPRLATHAERRRPHRRAVAA